MSQINNVYFENYRIFKERQKFQLKPINFLIGPNSSGKSSIFKAFLLLKSNIANDLQILDFSDTKHNLGTFENTLNNQSNSDKITFGFEATVNNDSPYSFNKIALTSKRSIYNLLIENNVKQEVNLKIFLTYKQFEESGKLRTIEIFKDNDIKAFLKLEIGNPTDEFHKLHFNHNIITKNKVLNEIFIRNVIRDSYQVEKNVEEYNYKVPNILAIGEDKILKYYDEPVLVFSNLYDHFFQKMIKLDVSRNIHKYLKGMPLRRVFKDFSHLIENTEYIEAVRANTKRLYTNDSQGTSFNELILEYRSRQINPIALNFTNKWLQMFDIADSFIFENVEGVANTVYLIKNEKKIALADLGYGITQFLPILMKISLEELINQETTYNVVKKTILLEEPETNLHPKFQSLLADFIADAIKTFEIRFIIETHSEYIIRKTQILTASKSISSKDTAIYYFNPSSADENTNQIIDININENGTLTKEFGNGFFDEAAELKYQLLKYKNNKKDA
jgi:predicted ATPase